jgi:hypothetical protein
VCCLSIAEEFNKKLAPDTPRAFCYCTSSK